MQASARLELQEYLERRAHRLLIWAERASVAALEPPNPRQVTAAVPALVASRFCCAADLRALVVGSRACCRTLGRLEVLAPLLRLLLHGFEQIRFLTEEVTYSVVQLEEVDKSARSRLSFVTKAELGAMKLQAQAATGVAYRGAPSGLPAELSRGVLELASMLLQPNEKAHDNFAMLRLASDSRVMDKAAAFRLERLNAVQRQRFLKLAALRAKLLTTASAVAEHSDAAAIGALAQWLQAEEVCMHENLRIYGAHKAKEAVVMHIIPLATWALRPHIHQGSLGRSAPPPPEPLPAELSSTRPQAVPRPPASVQGAAQALNMQRSKGPLAARRPRVQAITSSHSVTVHQPKRSAPLNASQAVEFWLQQYGGSMGSQCVGPDVNNSALAAGPGASAVLALSGAKARQKGGPTSTCSTASTEEDGASEQGPTRRSTATSIAEWSSLAEAAAAAAVHNIESGPASLASPPPAQPSLRNDIGVAATSGDGLLDDMNASSMLLEFSDDDDASSPSMTPGRMNWAFDAQLQY